ncbi:MAG: hypothetical protein H0X27_13445 [Caulobacteraceae bacterium]|nr:hypothetical protein [Caulobacteraceae bacterium]
MWFAQIIDELVPILGIFMIIAVVIGPIWVKSYFAARDRAQMHETLRVAYEKGQPVPPELIESLQSKVSERSMPTPERDLRRAIVLISVGLGLCGLGYFMWYGLMSVNDIAAYTTGTSIAGAGAIPGLIGVAYLVLWLTRRNVPRS